MKDLDYCYECQAYGDNYEEDENGDLVCLCGECQRNPFIEEGEGEWQWHLK